MFFFLQFFFIEFLNSLLFFNYSKLEGVHSINSVQKSLQVSFNASEQKFGLFNFAQSCTCNNLLVCLYMYLIIVKHQRHTRQSVMKSVIQIFLDDISIHLHVFHRKCEIFKMICEFYQNVCKHENHVFYFGQICSWKCHSFK